MTRRLAGCTRRQIQRAARHQLDIRQTHLTDYTNARTTHTHD